jgi:hypothetical protein
VTTAFRNAGYNEHDNPGQGLIGRIAYLEGTQGPGRIRTDTMGDVFFAPTVHSIKKLKQGQRVLVYEINEGPKPKADFMFNSQWEATTVVSLPKGKSHPKLELPDAVRGEILKIAGDSLKGFQTQQKFSKPFRIGQLVYGFYSGIYRIAQIKDTVAICEEVYNSKLARAHGATNQWGLTFCRPLPKDIERMLADDSLVP